MLIRKEIEEREIHSLGKYAVKSRHSKGRKDKEEEDSIRTCFMLDRDRVVHSKSFRRLKHKTQVFIAPPGDHYRSRLTHTLELNQIAKTIGAGLNLNLDLIEAMALAHDVGHTPFAHSGEQILNELSSFGFRHNENSIRVLTHIEQRREKSGLNLCEEVLDGVLQHSGYGTSLTHAYTLEGQVIRISDKIAYVQHDIDDSIRAGLLNINDLPLKYIEILGETHSKRIATLVQDTVYYTKKQMDNAENIILSPSPQVENALKGLREFMFENIYRGKVCQAERSRAMFVIEHLYNYYIKYPNKMSEIYQDIARAEGVERAVVDYISGMSDAFCISTFKDIYIPQSLVPGALKYILNDEA